MPYKDPEKRREHAKIYRQTEAYKQYLIRLKKSEEYKIKHKQYNNRYLKSDKGKKYLRRYNLSRKRKEYLNRYNQTEHYKKYRIEYMKKYNKVDKYKKYKTEYMKTYQKSNIGKLVKKRYSSSIKGKHTNNKWRKTPIAKIISTRARIKRRAMKNNYIETYTEKDWQDKLKVSNGVCNGFHIPSHYVGANKLTRDHDYPISKANEDFKRTGIKRIYSIDNMIPLCRSCNSKKQDQLIE